MKKLLLALVAVMSLATATAQTGDYKVEFNGVHVSKLDWDTDALLEEWSTNNRCTYYIGEETIVYIETSLDGKVVRTWSKEIDVIMIEDKVATYIIDNKTTMVGVWKDKSMIAITDGEYSYVISSSTDYN